mmetsp:Transcript_122206/g.346444  ORF Transcript_122206/g.346444 Transcript_122206/m.346444 type:complete len:235 (-) Transcript_122206:416-1120(-)
MWTPSSCWRPARPEARAATPESPAEASVSFSVTCFSCCSFCRLRPRFSTPASPMEVQCSKSRVACVSPAWAASAEAKPLRPASPITRAPWWCMHGNLLTFTSISRRCCSRARAAAKPETPASPTELQPMTLTDSAARSGSSATSAPSCFMPSSVTILVNASPRRSLWSPRGRCVVNSCTVSSVAEQPKLNVTSLRAVSLRRISPSPRVSTIRFLLACGHAASANLERSRRLTSS